MNQPPDLRPIGARLVDHRPGADVHSAAAMQRGKEGTGAQRVVRASEGAPRRILFLESSVGGGVIGGSLTGILELLPHLDRSRWEPALVLAEPKPALDPADVPLHVLTPRRGSGGVDRGALPVDRKSVV